MKIIIIGGNGTLGSAIAKALSQKHQIFIAGRSQGDLICDMESTDSLHEMFNATGMIDAVVVVAGTGPFLPLDQMTSVDFKAALNSKLMGQINTVLVGKKYINPKGSFTLTSGILTERPVVQSAALTVANSGVEGFVRAASMELTQRINCVSPTLVTESAPALGSFFPGIKTLSTEEVAHFYQKSVESSDTGSIYHAW